MLLINVNASEYCLSQNKFKMSNEQFKKSDLLKEINDSVENSKMCSFSIERLLAPSKKNEEKNTFLQQTELSSFCQESKS